MRRRELIDPATRHTGPFTAAGLREEGIDRDVVKRALATQWQAPVRGIYLPHREPISDEELAQVAALHAGPDAIVSGLLAARVHELRWLPADVPGTVVPIPHEVRRKDAERLVQVRRCVAFASLPSIPWAGVRLASPAQAVVDACRQVLSFRRTSAFPGSARDKAGWFERRCLREIRGIVLGAVADGRCTVDELSALVEAGPIRDSALLRRACVDAARGAASPPEAELIDGLLEHGVLIASNVEVWDGDLLVAVLDLHLVGTGVGAEVDSKEAHERADLLDATLLRHQRVEGYGMVLRHVTPNRYRQDPSRFHDTLFEQARDRLARGLGDPPGLRMIPRGPVMRGRGVSPAPYQLRRESPHGGNGRSE